MNFSSFSTSTPSNNNASDKRRAAANKNMVNTRLQKKPVVYRIFEDAAEYTDDPFWKTRLLAASRNDFIRKTTYFDGRILHKIKKRGEGKTEIPLDDPEKAAELFIEFHQKFDNIYSSQDEEDSKKAREEILNQQIVLQWSSCGKRIRSSLLSAYAKKIAEENSFDIQCEEQLRTDLNLLLANTLLGTKNVTMENNEISDIDLLMVWPEKNTYLFSEDLLEELNKKLSTSKPKRIMKKSQEVGCISATWNATVNPPKETTKKSK